MQVLIYVLSNKANVCTVGPEVNPHMVSLLYPVERNLKAVAVALNKPVRCAARKPVTTNIE